jgi:hypothetical protein
VSGIPFNLAVQGMHGGSQALDDAARSRSRSLSQGGAAAQQQQERHSASSAIHRGSVSATISFIRVQSIFEL